MGNKIEANRTTSRDSDFKLSYLGSIESFHANSIRCDLPSCEAPLPNFIQCDSIDCKSLEVILKTLN